MLATPAEASHELVPKLPRCAARDRPVGRVSPARRDPLHVALRLRACPARACSPERSTACRSCFARGWPTRGSSRIPAATRPRSSWRSRRSSGSSRRAARSSTRCRASPAPAARRPRSTASPRSPVTSAPTACCATSTSRRSSRACRIRRRDVSVTFVPHLSTGVARHPRDLSRAARAGRSAAAVAAAFEHATRAEPFISLAPSADKSRLHDVVGTNRCRIGWAVGERRRARRDLGDRQPRQRARPGRRCRT